MPHGTGDLRRDVLTIALVLGKRSGWWNGVGVHAGEEEVAVCVGVIRFERKGAAVAGFGFGEMAEVFVGIAKAVVCFGQIRFEGKGTTATGFRFG